MWYANAFTCSGRSCSKMATRSRIPVRVTQRPRTTTTETRSTVPRHASAEHDSVESQKITGPPELHEGKPASGHGAKKKAEVVVGARSSSRASSTQPNVPRTRSHNEDQTKPKSARTRQLQTTLAKAPLKTLPAVDGDAGRKCTLSWKASEPDQTKKPYKKLPKVTTMETHKIHRAQDVKRVVSKLHSTSAVAKRSTLMSQPAVGQQPAVVPLQSTSLSWVEQQKALGIAFEADEGALNSILTGRGVTAPLLDRTASLNIPTGVKSQFQGLRKGGSAFGTRASVYTSFESRYNLRDGLIPRKPMREDKLGSMHTESLVPVATPFRESSNRTLYKVAERNSVYMKYVTEEEWRSQNLSRTVQPTPACLAIATPGRVRLGANRQPVLETPFRVEQSANMAQVATARSSARSWRDIFTEKDGNHMSSNSISGHGEKHDDLRRTLTFTENETEGLASDVTCSSSINIADSARLAKPPGHTVATMCRLSEADEELIGIEEIERRLQSEIEAMEREKMADLERVAQILDHSGLVATQVGSANCSERRSISEQASLLDVLQRLSLGSSPELAVSHQSTSKPKQCGMQQQQQQQQLAKGSQLATTEVSPCSAGNRHHAWLAVSAAEGTASEHRTAASAEALHTAQLVPAVQAQLAGHVNADHTLNEQVPAAQTASLPLPPSELPEPTPCEELLHVPAASVCSSATVGSMPDEDAADLPTEMEIDHGSEAVDCSRQDGLHSGGAGASLLLLRSLHEDECLRSQSRYIATIDRLCSNTAVADHKAVEHEIQSVLNPGHHPATASSAAVATTGWGPLPAVMQSTCKTTATGAGPMASASASTVSAWSDSDPDPEALHMPVFRKTAGTISVVHCGIYSPGVVGKLESRSMAEDAEVENVGTEQNGPPAQCQQQQATTESPATRPLAASHLSSLGTIPQSVLPDSSCSALPGRQPVMPHKDHVLCEHPAGCSMALGAASNLQPMASGVGSVLNRVSAADLGNVRCSPAGLPTIALHSATIPCLTAAQAGSALSCASLDAAYASPHSAFVRPVVSASRTPLKLPPSGGATAALPPSAAHAADIVPSPMPLDLVQGCRVCSPPIVTAADGSSASTSTPELIYKLSLLGMVFNAAEKFENALLDEECTLYLCRASTRQLHSQLTRDLPDPVATSLTSGDDRHFIPIRETDSEGASSATSAQEGSAFHCYTP